MLSYLSVDISEIKDIYRIGNMMIKCKRVYDPVCDDDGYRVLIDRLWPRGIKKTDLQYDVWNKEVAPSNELRKWYHQYTEEFTQFIERYQQELNNTNAWQDLVFQAQQSHLTLLYSAKNTEQNHAIVLKAFIEEKMQSINKG